MATVDVGAEYEIRSISVLWSTGRAIRPLNSITQSCSTTDQIVMEKSLFKKILKIVGICVVVIVVSIIAIWVSLPSPTYNPMIDLGTLRGYKIKHADVTCIATSMKFSFDYIYFADSKNREIFFEGLEYVVSSAGEQLREE